MACSRLSLSSVLESASGLSIETTPATDKTQPISASHSPSSSRTRTFTSILLSERFSAFVSDDELAVLSKGVAASIY